MNLTPERLREAAAVAPSPRQLAWQQMEFYGFIHFGMNTFTGREWGDGTASPALFDPACLDAGQWARALKSAGMRGMILTCKHHDGFCLWPSAHTDYSVKYAPWKGGRGDVVREAAEACRRAGLKFGVYLSPWDRHDPRYGAGKPYDDYYVAQLTELLTGYGELFCVWLDGACGEGPNGRRQAYDWARYYETIRALQPGAVISVCGPDVRWCGNEAGHCRPSEWSVVPAALRDAAYTEERSQQEDSAAFARRVSREDEDLGSRAVLARGGALAWYPAEVDTSIRPGWFYHPQEDAQVRTAGELREGQRFTGRSLMGSQYGVSSETIRRAMRHLEGPLAKLTAPAAVCDADDYIWATLTDDTPIPDAMARLRAAYPNAMKLDYKPRNGTPDDAAQTAAEVRRRSFDELFSDFFVTVQGREPTEEETAALAELREEVFPCGR